MCGAAATACRLFALCADQPFPFAMPSCTVSGRIWRKLMKLRALSLALWTAIAGVALIPNAARSADMATKAPPSQGCVQAVDGVNGKLGGFDGLFGNKTYYE